MADPVYGEFKLMLRNSYSGKDYFVIYSKDEHNTTVELVPSNELTVNELEDLEDREEASHELEGEEFSFYRVSGDEVVEKLREIAQGGGE